MATTEKQASGHSQDSDQEARQRLNLRFLADECCPEAVVAALRDLGFDVRYIAEEAPGLSDTDVAAFAAEEGRILVTPDKDFGRLVVRLSHVLPGLVLLRGRRLHLDPVAKKTAILIAANAEKLAGAVTTLTDDRIRRRLLRKTN